MTAAKTISALRVMEAYPYRSVAGEFLPKDRAGEDHAAESILAALYLAGAPRGIEVAPRNWASVLRWTRAEGANLSSASRVLRQKGLRDEALALETPGLLGWSERRVLAGVVLTAASPEYPLAWSRKLGASSPAAIWKRGEMPSSPYLAIVGSRDVGAVERQFAFQVAAEAVRLGYAVVSGAAAGCDRAAAEGAKSEGRRARNKGGNSANCGRQTHEGRPTPYESDWMPLVEILPCGMALRRERFGGCVLSQFAPHEEFSGPNAMRRNALIYSMSEATVIVHARFSEGGTWRGAIEAHRRKLCRLIVREDEEAAASRALVGLGAARLSAPCDLELALLSEMSQGDLAL